MDSSSRIDSQDVPIRRKVYIAACVGDHFMAVAFNRNHRIFGPCLSGIVARYNDNVIISISRVHLERKINAGAESEGTFAENIGVCHICKH